MKMQRALTAESFTSKDNELSTMMINIFELLTRPAEEAKLWANEDRPDRLRWLFREGGVLENSTDKYRKQTECFDILNCAWNRVLSNFSLRGC